MGGASIRIERIKPQAVEAYFRLHLPMLPTLLVAKLDYWIGILDREYVERKMAKVSGGKPSSKSA